MVIKVKLFDIINYELDLQDEIAAEIKRLTKKANFAKAFSRKAILMQLQELNIKLQQSFEYVKACHTLLERPAETKDEIVKKKPIYGLIKLI